MPRFKQAERLIKILQKLSLNREITVNQLYEFFERGVPKRTLQRDLLELSSAEIPLMIKKGEGNERVWYIESSLRFIPETIGSQELLASYFLDRLSFVTKGTKLERDIKSLLKKAKQLISPEVFQSLDSLESAKNSFGITFSGYIDYSAYSNIIDILIGAISESNCCKITYNPASKETISELTVNPYMIVFHKGALYCIVNSQQHEGYIFLAIQRIIEVNNLSSNFRRSKDFDLQKLCRGRFGIYGHENLKLRRVVLKFSKDVAVVVAERVWHESQKLKHHRDGSITLEMKLFITDELRGWIASWLKNVKVIYPKGLLNS